MGTGKRPYTPICYDESNLEFLIKRYNDGAISPKICDFFIKDKLVNIQGPFGNKYYDQVNDSLMINNAAIKKKNIIMFCCGTGITPFYSILTNLSKDTKYNFSIYASFKSQTDNFLIDNICEKYAKKRCFYSDKNDRLTKDTVRDIINKYSKSVILICGTDNYNKMITDVVGDKNIYYIW